MSTVSTFSPRQPSHAREFLVRGAVQSFVFTDFRPFPIEPHFQMMIELASGTRGSSSENVPTTGMLETCFASRQSRPQWCRLFKRTGSIDRLPALQCTNTKRRVEGEDSTMIQILFSTISVAAEDDTRPATVLPWHSRRRGRQKLELQERFCCDICML